jgi:hypothetical protein
MAVLASLGFVVSLWGEGLFPPNPLYLFSVPGEKCGLPPRVCASARPAGPLVGGPDPAITAPSRPSGG